MRPFRKYPNGGDLPHKELPQVNLTASRANWEEQKRLRKELNRAQQDYNNLIAEYGLNKNDQQQFGFEDFSGGMSSKEELQAKLDNLNKSYKNVQDQFSSANKALIDLRNANPEYWENKTVSDVVTSEGLRALRNLRAEERLNNVDFKDFYNQYGIYTDPNIKFGYGPNASYSAKKARENWMEEGSADWFADKVNKAVKIGLGLAGGAAVNNATNVINAIGNEVSAIAAAGPAQLWRAGVTGTKNFLNLAPKAAPWASVSNLTGLGFGLHSMHNLSDPESITRKSISKAYDDPTAENIIDATGNTLMDGLGVLGSPGMGNALLSGPKELYKEYNKVATGNSRLTDLGVPAWKVEKPANNSIYSGLSRPYIARTVTDEEADLLSTFGEGMRFNSQAEWDAMEALTKSGATDFSKGNIPISRVIGYYNRGNEEQKAIEALKRGDVFTTPTEKSIRTWSAGVPDISEAEYLKGKTRLIIPSRYTKNLGSHFSAMPYDDARVGFIHADSGGGMGPYLNIRATRENELMGNIPEGFKVIGRSSEDGMNNLIIKPINNRNKFLNTQNTLTDPASNPLLAKAIPLFRGSGKLAKDVLKNTYKINPWAAKEAQEIMLVRARPVGQDPYVNMAEQLKAKQAAGEQLTWYQKNLLNPQTNPQMVAREKYFGQWFADNPSDLDFYINPGTRNFADDAQIEILKTRLPKSEAAKYSVKNFKDAKTLSNLHDTEYILPKDMVQSLERFPVEDLSKLQAEYKQMNRPHWLKGYKKVKPVVPNTLTNQGTQPLINFSNSSKVAPWNVYSSPEKVREKLQQSRDFIQKEGNKELADFFSEEGLRRARLAFKKTNPKLTDDEIDSLVADQMTELQNAINYNLPEYALKNPDIWKNFNIDNTNKFWLETNFPNNNAFAWDNPSFYEEMTNLEGIPTYANPNLINIDRSALGNFEGLPSRVNKSLLGSQQEFTRPYFRIPTISIGTQYIGDVPTMAHETAHVLQRAGIHPTDLELQKLVNKENKTLSGLAQKTWDQLFKLSPEYNNSFDYFYAPKGRIIPDEGYAFARETRQAMLDKGIIKDKFEKITPSKILQYRLSEPFSMKGGQRLTSIVPPWKWKGLSKIMNDMNVAIPGAVGVGAAGYGLGNSKNNDKQYKKGGSLAKNIPTYYNFKGTPIYRDTTSLPFATGGDLDNPPDTTPTLPKLKDLNTNEVSSLLYNTVANIIERKKAEGKILPEENLDLRGVVAQILFESGNAKSGLTSKYNNFGGLRATQGFIDKGGKTVEMVNKATGKKFLWRAYDTPEQGLEAQIDFLLNNPRYRKAGVFNAKNTKEYLAAISKAGYAGNESNYARKVAQMANSLDKRLKKVNPETAKALYHQYNVSPTLTVPDFLQDKNNLATQIDNRNFPEIQAMRENLTIPTKSNIDILKNTTSNLEELPTQGPEIRPPSFVVDEGYYMSGIPTPQFKSSVAPFMGKGASNYQESGGVRLPYINRWNQNQFVNPIAARVQSSSNYDPDYYYGTDNQPGELEKASLENRRIDFSGGFASKQMQQDVEQYNKDYDLYEQRVSELSDPSRVMFSDATKFKYGSNLYERQGLIPSMYASSLGRYYNNGGRINYSMYDVFEHGTYGKGGNMIKRADGSYSQRGLWDNIRANKGSGKKPTKEMLAQERKINNKANGGYLSSFKASNIQTY